MSHVFRANIATVACDRRIRSSEPIWCQASIKRHHKHYSKRLYDSADSSYSNSATGYDRLRHNRHVFNVCTLGPQDSFHTTLSRHCKNTCKTPLTHGTSCQVHDFWRQNQAGVMSSPTTSSYQKHECLVVKTLPVCCVKVGSTFYNFLLSKLLAQITFFFSWTLQWRNTSGSELTKVDTTWTSSFLNIL